MRDLLAKNRLPFGWIQTLATWRQKCASIARMPSAMLVLALVFACRAVRLAKPHRLGPIFQLGCLTPIIPCVLLGGQAAWAHSNNYSESARGKFTQKKYDEAIVLFRKHLRKFPKDYNSWNQMGASYYHTGLPRRALRYMKHVETKTTDKSYNYYYQGLCYTAIGDPEKAKEYFGFAASRFNDEYASRATFEMAAIEYNERNKTRANYWLSSYASRFPSGVYRAQVTRMQQSLTQGVWLKDIEGIEKPDPEAALFKYNKLSLGPKPHYWFGQAGWQYITESGQEPAPGGGLKSRSTQQMALVGNAGAGIGPWRDGPMSAFGGYTYRQLWYTDDDRLNTYLEEPTDFEYFPFRGDLLERRHQFYGDFRREFAGNFFFGVFGRYEFARIGSTFFPGPDDNELRKVLKISDTQLLIPWIGASYLQHYRTLAYLYLRKEINEDSPEHSNKTYDFGTTSGEPAFSLGISHNMEFPDASIDSNIEIFRYEFIYNDYWLDYTREGIIADIQHELVPRWFITASLGMYRDSYVLTRPKMGSCSAKPKVDGAVPAEPETPTDCERVDNGRLINAGVYWNWSQFHRIAANVQFVSNTNPDQQEFEEEKMTVQVLYTMAFPSVTRVSRFVDRYADTAFTKEAE